MSNDGVILYTNGKDGKRASLKAGEQKQLYFVSEVLDSAPFSIRIDSCDALENNEETTLTISDITITEGDNAPAGSNDPHRSELADLDEYTIQMASNAEIVLDRGAWYYSCDGTPGTDYTFAETPKYDNGTVTFAFTNMNNIATKPNHQLRYQPDYAVGTAYTATFTIKLENADEATLATLYFMYGSGENNVTMDNAAEFGSVVDNGDGTYTVTYTAEVDDAIPFWVQVATSSETAVAAKLTVSDIAFVESTGEIPGGETPDDDGVALEMKSNADIVAAPGIWAYTASGADNLASIPVLTTDGSVIMNIASLSKSTAENPVIFQLRYQPEFAVGTAYTATFTIKLESSDAAALATLYFMYGSDGNIVTMDNAAEFGSVTDNGDGTYTVTYTAEVGEAIPFWVQVATNSDTAVAAKLTVSDIAFVESTGEIPGGGLPMTTEKIIPLPKRAIPK